MGGFLCILERRAEKVKAELKKKKEICYTICIVVKEIKIFFNLDNYLSRSV